MHITKISDDDLESDDISNDDDGYDVAHTGDRKRFRWHRRCVIAAQTKGVLIEFLVSRAS